MMTANHRNQHKSSFNQVAILSINEIFNDVDGRISVGASCHIAT